jgi:hypothetical protein
MMRDERGLHQTRNTGTCVEVPNVALDRADHGLPHGTFGRVAGSLTTGSSQSGDLNGISDCRASSVSFEVVHPGSWLSSHLPRVSNHIGVSVDAGSSKTHLCVPIIGDGTTLDRRIDVVPVVDGFLKALQDYESATVTTDGSISPLIVRADPSTLGTDSSFLPSVTACVRSIYSDPAC